MLTSIHIQGFKGFRDTKIPELRRVNLIVGGQNSGKTSLLEAVYAGDKNDSDWQVKKIIESEFRKQTVSQAFSWIPNDTSKPVSIKLEPRDYFHKTSFTTFPIQDSELVRLYDIAVHGRTKKKWIALLAQIESRLEGLESVAVGLEKQPTVHAEVTGIKKLMPLSMLGQGFNRLAYLYAGLLGQNANIALIDEIENGIHYSALPILWQGIANIAKELDIQIFATTHSLECIRAASDAFKDSPDDFQVIRLNRKGDNIEADIIPHDYVEAVVMHGGEIR